MSLVQTLSMPMQSACEGEVDGREIDPVFESVAGDLKC